eukprot:5805160-Alexandrium_andersonii.AAC.1
MSASLVGSEMCIRDRPLQPVQEGAPRLPERAGSQAAWMATNTAFGGCACLLYTSDAADDM